VSDADCPNAGFAVTEARGDADHGPEPDVRRSGQGHDHCEHDQQQSHRDPHEQVRGAGRLGRAVVHGRACLDVVVVMRIMRHREGPPCQTSGEPVMVAGVRRGAHGQYPPSAHRRSSSPRSGPAPPRRRQMGPQAHSPRRARAACWTCPAGDGQPSAGAPLGMSSSRAHPRGRWHSRGGGLPHESRPGQRRTRMRWPRPAEGRLDGRGHSAHRLETGVACAMGEIPVDEGRCDSRVSSDNGLEEMGSDTHLIELRLPCRLHGYSRRHESARWGLMPIVSRGSCTHDRVMTGLPRASPPFDVTSDARSVSGAELRRLRTREIRGESTASRPVRATDDVHRDHRAALSRAARSRGAALTDPRAS
jgi:hypothetical protein